MTPIPPEDGWLHPAREPNPVQARMIARRYGLFIHFGINTFLDQEWTDGTHPATCFAPSGMDTDQWAQMARDAGMKYAIFTAKHHEGFCLWDSAETDYGVMHSRHREDLVSRVAESCRRYDLELGLYYSLWDRHERCYSNHGDYVAFMQRQLSELLGHYGPICELWLDGGWEKACGQWDIPALYRCVKQIQPSCAMGVNWTIGRPDNVDAREVKPAEQREGFPIRYFPSDFRLGDPYLPANPDPKLFTHASETYYLPFESTVCLNDKWFFNRADQGLRTVEQLTELYGQATAQDNILILNSPPDRGGRMPERNVRRLLELRQRLNIR